MSYILDTNCYLRLADRQSPLRNTILNAIRNLRREDQIIFTTPQIIAEFWNVCTRESSMRGGLELTPKQTERKIDLMLKHFPILSDSSTTFDIWRLLVSENQIVGVGVHDAKLVASMIAHSVQHLVTFNTKDFRRYNMISIVDPRDI
ncbi:MAG: type II toxin-antitoxin system VapC family toxin [Pyrinomonadaceae bacterium]